MSISVQCECGHNYSVHDRYAGQVRKCLYCGAEYLVPGTAIELELDLQPDPKPIAPAQKMEYIPEPMVPAQVISGNPCRVLVPEVRPEWHKRYLFLAIALLPLIFSSFQSRNGDVKDRFIETFSKLSDEEKKRIEELENKDEISDKEIINALPSHKLQGALLPVNTSAHWIFALISAMVFLFGIMLLMPSKTATPAGLILTALFTGTIGIVMLLVAQWLAFHMPWVRGANVIAAVALILKVIGLAYALALDPQYGFPLSLIGFTFGVGLCEEVCKALPLAQHFTGRSSIMDWRGACIWGLASGVGFGVSEGITYSSDYYNGIYGGDIYLIRFASCVALHAVWAGSAGICLWKKQDSFSSQDSWWETLFNLVWIVFPMMLLHGLYDTVLKFDQHLIAMLVALASFAYFGWMIEDAKKYEREMEPHVVTA